MQRNNGSTLRVNSSNLVSYFLAPFYEIKRNTSDLSFALAHYQ